MLPLMFVPHRDDADVYPIQRQEPIDPNFADYQGTCLIADTNILLATRPPTIPQAPPDATDQTRRRQSITPETTWQHQQQHTQWVHEDLLKLPTHL